MKRIAVLISLFSLLVVSAQAYEVNNLTQLTNGPLYENEPVFSFDGTKIAYRYLHPPYSWANCDIWTMNTNGSSQTRITTASNGEFNPSFLPDGRITYTKEFGSNDYDIWMVNANGSNPHFFIGGSYRQQNSCWHPNGNKIVYESEYQSSGPTEIWTADSNGSNKIKLTVHTTDGYAQSFPIYSRSGSLIAYASPATSSAEYHIWVMNANGSNKQPIPLGDKTQYPMFWWPDDSMLGYIQDGEIWLYNFATHTSELLLSIPGQSINSADLSPDGNKLVFDVGHIWTGDIVSTPNNRKRVIIDMDPSFGECDPDDILALIYAAQSPYCDLEGVTVGWGNMWDAFSPGAPMPEWVWRLLLNGKPMPDTSIPTIDYYFNHANEALNILVYDAQILDNKPPLKKGASFEDTWRMLGIDPTVAIINPLAVKDKLEPTEAVNFINDLVSENPGEITIIAQGTLTNLATAMYFYPGGPSEFMNDVGEIWITGGAVDVSGNVALEFEAEYNIWRDPPAAEYVFASVEDSPGKVNMVPLDATMDAPISFVDWHGYILPSTLSVLS